MQCAGLGLTEHENFRLRRNDGNILQQLHILLRYFHRSFVLKPIQKTLVRFNGTIKSAN